MLRTLRERDVMDHAGFQRCPSIAVPIFRAGHILIRQRLQDTVNYHVLSISCHKQALVSFFRLGEAKCHPRPHDGRGAAQSKRPP